MKRKIHIEVNSEEYYEHLLDRFSELDGEELENKVNSMNCSKCNNVHINLGTCFQMLWLGICPKKKGVDDKVC